MKVKIENRMIWEKVIREPGSVIEVPESVYEKNIGWMKPTDAELKDAPAAKAKPDGDK